MIHRISVNDYLQRIDGMPAERQDEYRQRVGEWLRRQAPLLLPKMREPAAALQGAVQLGAGWNDMECAAFEDGVILLTAMAAREDTWLPEMIYTKSAKRTIKRMYGILRGVGGTAQGTGVTQARAAAPRPAAAGTGEEPAAKKQDTQPIGSGTLQQTPAGTPAVPSRPKSIHQYIHLLPEETQKKALAVKDLLRDLDTARENARRLMEDGGHADKIASWAKTATKIDAQLKAIYREIDACWDRLVETKAVSLDAFGNAVVNEEILHRQEKPRQGRPPLTEEQKAEKEARKKDDNRRKASLLRKFLIDRRNAVTDAQREKWVKKYREMVRLGGEEAVTDKVREAAAHYGIEISADGRSAKVIKKEKKG